MSTPSESSEYAQKDTAQESLKDVGRQYNVDGVEDDDGYQFNHEGVKIDGYTKKDKGDMTRMGKKQELMVGWSSDAMILQIADNWTEKFPSSFRIEFHGASTSNMGIPSNVIPSLFLCRGS